MTKKILLGLIPSVIILAVYIGVLEIQKRADAKNEKVVAGQALTEDEEDEEIDEMISILKDYGGMGNYRDRATTAKEDYDDIQLELEEKFEEDPQKVIKPIEEILALEAGEGETEKFLAIHALGKLPLEQTTPIIKKEIEKELPELEGEGEYAEDLVIQAIARKMAGVEALVRSDPDYILDLIEDPDTNRAVKRAAVEAYIESDDNPEEATAEVKGLLTRQEEYMVKPFEDKVSQTTIKDFFLGGEEAQRPPAKKSKGKGDSPKGKKIK